MAWIHKLWIRLRSLFGRDRFAKELDSEIQFHLDELIAENIGAGMTPEEAKYAAMRGFGNSTLLKEETREAWGWMWLEQIGQDIRYGFRVLSNKPGFTAVVILTLALGIGANAAVFSVVNSVLLKPLNYPKAEELVALHQTAPGAAGLADFENGLHFSFRALRAASELRTVLPAKLFSGL
jgi:hypothetical protein